MSARLAPAARRRTLAALAAAGLPVVGLAHADPPALPSPGDAAESWSAPALPAPGAPAPLAEAFDRAARPLPAPDREWTDLAPPKSRRGAARRRVAGVNEADVNEADVNEEEGDGARGWLSFAPLRVRPVSDLRPIPDPVAGGYDPGRYDYGAPRPAPAPLPEARFDDLPAGPALPPPGYEDPTDGFTTVPRSSNYGPDYGAAAAPPAEHYPPAPPLRDLRTPEPPPFAPYAPPEPVGGAPFAPSYGYDPPPAAPYGAEYGAGYGGIGAGMGAGPIADLAAAGGMCDLGACDGGVPLFRAVKIEDRRNIHPRALRKVIAVADPRLPGPPRGLKRLFHRECRGCEAGCHECAPPVGGPALVFVEVCVPPCRCEAVKVTRRGHRVHLDYGKYEVTLTSRDGCVEVDYDD